MKISKFYINPKYTDKLLKELEKRSSIKLRKNEQLKDMLIESNNIITKEIGDFIYKFLDDPGCYEEFHYIISSIFIKLGLSYYIREFNDGTGHIYLNDKVMYNVSKECDILPIGKYIDENEEDFIYILDDHSLDYLKK